MVQSKCKEGEYTITERERERRKYREGKYTVTQREREKRERKEKKMQRE